MLKENELKRIQDKIQYRFKNKKLLQQAFTRKSYSSRHAEADNEVLEFYGDRVLDLAVIKEFYNQFGKINNRRELISSKNVGELCQSDIELVKNANLAEQIVRLGFTKYLQVLSPKEKMIPKNKADLFEAILGAVAVDSNWDWNAIETVYHSMMIYSKDQIKDEAENPVEVFETLIWEYQICKTENKYTKVENGYECHSVMLIGEKAYDISGFGTTEHLAKNDACEYGCKIIRLVLKKEFLEGESYSEQLDFLFRLNFIAEPDFKFEYYPANSNYPEDLWRCSGTVMGSEKEYQSEDTNMYGAKEQVCYAILCDVLEIQTEEIELSGADDFTQQTGSEIVRGKGLLQLAMSLYGKKDTVA